jgi:Flp pilus assembly protein TadG
VGSRRGGRGEERGAALVEATVILPVLMLILFGIMEYGLLFRTNLTISDATRAGARVAVAQPRNDGYHLAAAAAVSGSMATSGIPSDQIGLMVIYRADPTTGGVLGGGASPADVEACTTACWKFDWDHASRSYVPRATPQWPPLSQFACGTEGETDYLGVQVRASHRFITGLLQGELSLTERTVMRLEPLPLTDECRPIG